MDQHDKQEISANILICKSRIGLDNLNLILLVNYEKLVILTYTTQTIIIVCVVKIKISSHFHIIVICK